jgi:hypothetical protein
MHILIASLPMLCYGLALVLGFFRIGLPFASAELSPLVQWLLFLALGLLSDNVQNLSHFQDCRLLLE